MEEAMPNPGHGNKQLAERVASPAVRNLELTVEAVVEEYVGSFGWSQFLHVLLVLIVWVFDSQNTLVAIFSDARPKSWRCINNSSSSLYMSSGSRDDVSSVCALKPRTWEWVGGHESSIVAKWGLFCCRRFLAAVPASMFFIGSLRGSAFFGHLADASLGRKRTVLLSCILSSATTFLTSLSLNIWIYALLRFVNGFSQSGIGICCIVLATEVVGHKWRGPVSQYGFFFFTAGFFSLPLIAYPTRKNWRNLYRILSLLPLSYSVLSFPFISESPRWLLVRGRSKEALNVLRKFTRRNGKTLLENLCLANPSNPKEGGENEALTKTCTKESLWRTKWAAKRMITVMIAGFGVGFVYYGVQLNVENLTFNLYFSVGINALMEILAIIFGTILLGLTSRRLLFSLSAFLVGISCLLCIIFTHGKHGNKAYKSRDGSWAQLIIEGVGFMVASIAYDVLYIYCVELFPTNVRNFALSQSRLSLMLGASIAPLLVVAGRETKNAPLYDSLKQQEEKEKHRDVGQSNNIQA
ncbi:hypothetical protein OIU76_022990 [Salix suchowensis]|nr:hypothetical protein OIU76_022990 [Salix suchowensis]